MPALLLSLSRRSRARKREGRIGTGRKTRRTSVMESYQECCGTNHRGPKTKPGEKPFVPKGLYVRKANEFHKHCKGGLQITADDLQNKVRAMDKKQKHSRPCPLQSERYCIRDRPVHNRKHGYKGVWKKKKPKTKI